MDSARPAALFQTPMHPMRGHESLQEFLARMNRQGGIKTENDRARLQGILTRNAQFYDALRSRTQVAAEGLLLLSQRAEQTGDPAAAKALKRAKRIQAVQGQLGNSGLTLAYVENLFDIRRIAALRKYSVNQSRFHSVEALQADLALAVINGANPAYLARVAATYAAAFFATQPDYIKALENIGVCLAELLPEWEVSSM